MASTFILKRKLFADNVNVNVNNDNRKSSFGKKLAIGTGATLATVGTGLAMGRAGLLGPRAMLNINQRIGRAGASISRYGKQNNIKFLQNTGDKMVTSGSYRSAVARTNLTEKRLGRDLTDAQRQASIAKRQKIEANNYRGIKTSRKSAPTTTTNAASTSPKATTNNTQQPAGYTDPNTGNSMLYGQR